MSAILGRTAAAIGLIALAPMFAVIASVIRLIDGGPAIFTQRRTGFRGRPFDLYKFRTMREIHDGDGSLLPDEYRITSFGRFLRRFSLDELPQLCNVVKGDLALVGPRPLMHRYWERKLYSADQARRFDVKPGLTGWVQVNGRNSLTWEEKFELDMWYVDNYSPMLDLKILLRTVSHVLHGRGISQNGHATAEEFRGSGREVETAEASVMPK